MSQENIRTNMTYPQAIEAINDYMARTGKSQTVVAKELGYNSPSGLSLFVGGTHKAPTNMIAAIERLLKITEKQTQAPKKPGFVMTTSSGMVTSLISQCHVRGELGVAYGDPGMGKTMAIRQYAKDNPEAIVITIISGSTSVAAIRRQLAEKLKIVGVKQNCLTEEIVAKLKGSKKIIIVDEAQHLKAAVVNYLRGIMDATEDEDTGERIGMALIGNDEINHELRVRQVARFSQIADRVVSWTHITNSLAKMSDMKLLFGGKDSGIDSGALNILHKISTQISIRKAVQVFTEALTIHNVQDYSELTAEKIAEAVKFMNLRVAA